MHFSYDLLTPYDSASSIKGMTNFLRKQETVFLSVLYTVMYSIVLLLEGGGYKEKRNERSVVPRL